MQSAHDLERRQLLRSLAGLSVAALPLAAADSTNVSAQDVQGAAHIAGEALNENRLALLAAVVERNMRQFQMVRDFEMEDRIGPAPLLIPR